MTGLVIGLIKSMDSVDSARRRSCELVNTPLPCVNKAIHHIRKLEGKAKELFVEVSDKTG